jgi:hypothetical protein
MIYIVKLNMELFEAIDPIEELSNQFIDKMNKSKFSKSKVGNKSEEMIIKEKTAEI